MRYTGVIPARYNSSRFPGKSIALLDGIPIVVRIYQRALLFPDWHQLLVATDDERVVSVCDTYNVPCLMTSDKHPDCIDRVFEVSEKIQADRYVIIQGDDPFFDASALNVDLSPDTVGFYTHLHADDDNPHLVKVVLDLEERALYFSRTLIPFSFETTRRGQECVSFYKQVGLYSFSGPMLRVFNNLGMSRLEKIEGVGLLRLVENGYNVHMRYIDHKGVEIDTPQDLERAERLCHESCQ